MQKTITISKDTQTTVEATGSNIKYIVEDGVDIIPSGKKDYGIDAYTDGNHRTIQMNGHIESFTGITFGRLGYSVDDSTIVVGKTGSIDAKSIGVGMDSDNGAIINHGTIHGGEAGIFAIGANLTVTNSGSITSTTNSAVLIGGDHSEIDNSGTIIGFQGVSLYTDASLTTTLHNSGVIQGKQLGVSGGNGFDVVVNSGKISGDISLFDNDDHYDGKGGVVNGLVDAGAGNDVLKGGDGVDRFSGGEGNDRLTGRGGADHFIFSTTFAADKITDFDAKGHGHDVVDLSHMTGFNDFASLSGIMYQSGDDTVLNFGGGDVLTLHNVELDDLSKSDFLF